MQQQAKHDFKRRRELQLVAIRREQRRSVFAQRRMTIASEQEWAMLDLMRRGGQLQEIEEQKELEEAEDSRSEGESEEVRARDWQSDNQLIIIVDPQLQSTIRELLARKVCPSDLSQAINDINETLDAFKLHRGVITIRKLLSRCYNEAIIQQLRESEAIVVLHRLIDQEVFKQLQLQAQWALANISFGDKYCEELIELGTLDVMIRVLRQKEKYFVNTALLAIGNICFSSALGRTIAIQSQVVQDIIELANDTLDRKLFDDCLWTAANLCKGLKLSQHPNEVKNFFALACESIQPGFLRDGEAFELCLSFIYNFTRNFMPELIELGTVGRLISLSRKGKEEKSAQRFIAIKILSVLSEAEQDVTSVLIRQGILDLLMQLLLEIDETLIVEALFTLSNLAGTCRDHAERIFDHQQMLTTCRILMDNHCLTYDVCYVFLNLSMYAEPFRVFCFYENIDAVNIVSQLLNQEYIDDQLMKVALQLLARVLSLGQLEEMKEEGRNTAREQFIRSGALDTLVHIVQDKENHDVSVTSLAKNCLNDFFLDFSEEEG